MISTESRSVTRTRVRLPDLGRRGGGWVILQVVLLVAIGAAGFTGPAWNGSARKIGAMAGAALMASGIGLLFAGILGLRRQLTPYPRPVADGHLIEDGAFGLVRHPMYGGGVLAAVGWGLAMASPLALAGAAALGVFADLKSRREEAWLGEQFAGYAAYRRRTRRLVPWLY